MYTIRGLSLIGMLVALGLLAILTSIAVPAFHGIVAGDNASAQIAQFQRAVEYARSVAMKRGYDTTLCASSDGTDCSSDGNWTVGWIVFPDPDDTGTPQSSSAILRVHTSLSGASQLIGDNGAVRRITFDRYGLLAGAYSGTIVLHPNPDRIALRRCLFVSSVGKVTVGRAGSCS